MRITKYKTTLSEDGKAVLEKELSVNYPELDRKMNGPEKVVRLAKEFEGEKLFDLRLLEHKLRVIRRTGRQG